MSEEVCGGTTQGSSSSTGSSSIDKAREERGCSSVPAPPRHELKHSEVFDEDGIPIPDNLRRHFFDGGRLLPEDAMELIDRAELVFRKEPNVLTLGDPISVCGDVHGQYYDLMTLFQLGGDPAETDYLFLGDYVDRGCFSTEVSLYLFALKVLRPNHLWMLRGNHECRHLTTYFNFKEECLHKYNEEVYNRFQNAFDALPLAAVLSDRYLCLHGGLSPDIKCIDDIMLIDRFQEPPTSGAMCDVLWADPMEDEEEALCPDALFLHNELRGCSYVFSFAAVEHFLEENNLLCLIRAHEAQDEGFRMFRKVTKTGFPGVICVFSAPNYCDTYDNKAAILQIVDKVVHVRQFHSVEHPYVLTNFMNAFNWSLPFVADKLLDILGTLSGGVQGDNTAAGFLFERMRRIEEQQESVLVRRGTIIRAKVMAVVRMIKLLEAVRRVSSRGSMGSIVFPSSTKSPRTSNASMPNNGVVGGTPSKNNSSSRFHHQQQQHGNSGAGSGRASPTRSSPVALLLGSMSSPSQREQRPPPPAAQRDGAAHHHVDPIACGDNINGDDAADSSSFPRPKA